MKKFLPILIIAALAVVGYFVWKKMKSKAPALGATTAAGVSAAAAKAPAAKRRSRWGRLGGFAKSVGSAGLKAGGAGALSSIPGASAAAGLAG